MARYQLVIAYDGTHFAGYQRQVNARTVQHEIEEALRTLGWRGERILAAGRTDRGVHASGQVIAFDLIWDHSTDSLQAALNSNLPSDIAIRSVVRADPEFHPRYDAMARRYHYQIFTCPVRDPFRERFAWRVWPDLDPGRLEKAASSLLGEHDFAAFGKPAKPSGSTRREVKLAEWGADGDHLIFRIEANGFLFRMVRRIVKIQVDIAHERREPGFIDRCLNQPGQVRVQGLAPPNGLFLTEVSYPH